MGALPAPKSGHEKWVRASRHACSRGRSSQLRASASPPQSKLLVLPVQRSGRLWRCCPGARQHPAAGEVRYLQTALVDDWFRPMHSSAAA